MFNDNNTYENRKQDTSLLISHCRTAEVIDWFVGAVDIFLVWIVFEVRATCLFA